MYVIDRTIAIIRPKQPLVDWINAVSDLGDAFSLEQIGRECLTFLMPRYVNVTEVNVKEAFKELLPRVFVVVLSGWCTVIVWPNHLPARRRSCL